MRILLLHNFYGSSAPSGENRVVLEERDLLRDAGHQVIEHFADSDTVRGRGLLTSLRTALQVPWNRSARSRLRRRIQQLQPDILHVHNVFPLFSPAIFGAAAGSPTAVVHTLHNYRAFCPAALLLRDGRICTDCMDRHSVLPALRHGCYRNSRLSTLPLAACVALNRRLDTYSRHVQAFIALTGFQQAQLGKAGLPLDRIFVKPNCLPSMVLPLPWSQRDPKCIFVGRISREKGVQVLLDAWALWGAAAPRLDIVGDGPDLAALRGSLPPALAGRISFCGRKSPAETQELLSRARLLIMPSICYEGFPLVFREAVAYGVPAVASRIGALPELIETRALGRLFDAGDSPGLHQVVSACWNDDAALRAMSGAAIAESRSSYSPQANLAALQSIYARALASKQRILRAPGSECPIDATR